MHPPSPWKKSPPSFPATPSKIWGPVKPPLFENLVGGSTPQQKGEGGGGAHYEFDLKWNCFDINIKFLSLRFPDSKKWRCNFNVRIRPKCPIFSLFSPHFQNPNTWIEFKQLSAFSSSKVAPFPLSGPGLVGTELLNEENSFKYQPHKMVKHTQTIHW